MKDILAKILKDRRLWIITILIFALLIAVFDRNNLIETWRIGQDIKELQIQQEYYQEKITQDSTLLQELKDDTFLERFAREKYLMKREGEDIYVVE